MSCDVIQQGENQLEYETFSCMNVLKSFIQNYVPAKFHISLSTRNKTWIEMFQKYVGETIFIYSNKKSLKIPKA